MLKLNDEIVKLVGYSKEVERHLKKILKIEHEFFSFFNSGQSHEDYLQGQVLSSHIEELQIGVVTKDAEGFPWSTSICQEFPIRYGVVSNLLWDSKVLAERIVSILIKEKRYEY